jgi:hypothetical protein
VSDSPKKKVNLNSATQMELAALPHSHPLLARRILSRRWHHGAFRDFGDLERVPGVNRDLTRRWADVAVIEPPEIPAPLVTWESRWARSADKAEPIVFAGNTTMLQATLPLENRGLAPAHEVVMRVKGGDLKDADGAPLDRIGVTLKLDPGQVKRALASVALDPATPPGRYEANIIMASQSYPVVFQVPPVASLEIVPSSFLLRESPGTTITREIHLKNTGNIDVTITGFAAVLEEQGLLLRAILNALERKELDKPEVRTEDVLTALVRELREAVESEPTLTGRFEDEKRKGKDEEKQLTISPGHTVLTELRFQVPPSVLKGRRYTTKARVANAMLHLEFQPV